jgi:hypothetical protein
MEWALFATGCVIIALVAHSIIVTGKVHRRLIDRLTDITRIEYESEADRNNVSVKYYVTVRNQLAVVLTIAATDSPITMPDHDAALSTVFINNVSQRAASYKLKRQSLDIRPYTTEATLYHLQGKQPMETHSPDRIINPGSSITVVNLYLLRADYGVFNYSDAQHQPLKAADINSIRIRINALQNNPAEDNKELANESDSH